MAQCPRGAGHRQVLVPSAAEGVSCRHCVSREREMMPVVLIIARMMLMSNKMMLLFFCLLSIISGGRGRQSW